MFKTSNKNCSVMGFLYLRTRQRDLRGPFWGMPLYSASLGTDCCGCQVTVGLGVTAKCQILFHCSLDLSKHILIQVSQAFNDARGSYLSDLGPRWTTTGPASSLAHRNTTTASSPTSLTWPAALTTRLVGYLQR